MGRRSKKDKGDWGMSVPMTPGDKGRGDMGSRGQVGSGEWHLHDHRGQGTKGTMGTNGTGQITSQ